MNQKFHTVELKKDTYSVTFEDIPFFNWLDIDGPRPSTSLVGCFECGSPWPVLTILPVLPNTFFPAIVRIPLTA